MTWNKMLEDDMENVFFSEESFDTIKIILNNDIENPIVGYYDTKSESIFDSASEYTEVSATEPSILLKRSDANRIDFDTKIEIEIKKEKMFFSLLEKDEESVELVRIFLEKKRGNDEN